MIIDAPFNIGILDSATGDRELQLDFTEEFRHLNIARQADEFNNYIHRLVNEISRLDETDANRQGMITVKVIAEQLLPHIEANEIPLEENIMIELQQNSPFGNIRLES